MERLTTERLDRLERNGITVTMAEASSMACELLDLRAGVAVRDAAPPCPVLDEEERDRPFVDVLARYTVEDGRPGAAAWVQVPHAILAMRTVLAAQVVQEIPSPPLGRELGRSPIPTPRRQEREALLSIVRASCEVDTVRKAALALLGEVQP